MDKINISLTYCYGITALQHTFDFSNKNMPVVLYAPNGTMKTSLAKSLRDYSRGGVPKDLIFDERESACNVEDQNSAPVPPESIFVVESINEKYSSERISSLLASDDLKSEYDSIFNTISKKLDDLFKKLKKQSGLTKDAEASFCDAFKVSSTAIIDALARLDREVNSGQYAEFANVKYKVIFGPKVIDFLKDGDIQVLIGEYTATYDKILENSKYFKKGTFNHSNAEIIAKNLKANGWFDGGHSVNLSDGDRRMEIQSEADLTAAIQLEKNQILSDPALQEKFNKVEKAITSAELRELRDYLVDNPELIPELNNIDQFKQRVWIAYLIANQTDYLSLVSEFDSSQVRLREIISEAEAQQTRWENVVDLFNRRFHVPFEVKVVNKSDAILNSRSPQLAFYFKDRFNGVERQTSKDALDQVLSNGEKRALYILNIIFEVEARREGNIETVFVFDDIADSFDYKNKYAIIEYLSDIKNDPLFHLIVLTHNFDFYRTIKGRLGIYGANKVLCSRSENSIALVEDNLSENPFADWKDNLGEAVKLIASIPFVRNLAEYTGNTAAFNTLTALLHIKAASEAITVSELRNVFGSVLNAGSFYEFDRSDVSVISIIESECEAIMNIYPDELTLECKIALSMGIRLKAERILIQEIADPVFVNAIQKNQTSKLIRRYSNALDADPAIMKTMQRVQLMTPENIHLNSFMYEPILDLSGFHLQSLFAETSGHLAQ
ncbi:hypothetical protein [Falsigemmobacter faecalis]|uniref:Phage infection protein n=1 Tax=Falsigemmobacter faecalis TaxID=2488730 RepID=A0A3P3DBU0_9RHOB|nr:hypothetical protein [Falsigemmobacter faecalis]RRH71294.1 hypothetical protein EG244_16600 [Falsigemmobacter faecalis]